MLILKKAQYLITNRVNSRESEWDVLFPSLHKDDVPSWMDLLSVVEAAHLVYALFGPESTAQRSIDQKTIDVKIREAKFSLDFTDEDVEDDTFGNLNDILEGEITLNGPLSSDRLCELSKIISSRLPIDSQIVTSYRELFAMLTDSQRQKDTPQQKGDVYWS